MESRLDQMVGKKIKLQASYAAVDVDNPEGFNQWRKAEITLDKKFTNDKEYIAKAFVEFMNQSGRALMEDILVDMETYKNNSQFTIIETKTLEKFKAAFRELKAKDSAA